MARTARSLHARKKRRKILKQAKGYRGTKNSSYKRAKEQVWKSGVYAYEGRKQRKRDFRSLWIQRINAGAREHGLSYSQLIHGLRLAEIDLDRKVLADLAATEPDAFAAVVAQAQNALNGDPVQRRIEADRKPEPQARQTPETRETEPAPESAEEPEASADESATEVEAADAAERKAGEPDVDFESGESTGAQGRITVSDVEEAAGDDDSADATDAAERKAEELGVDLSTVEGTGANGRITVGDVEKAANSGS